MQRNSPTATTFAAQVALNVICVLALIALGAFPFGARDVAARLAAASYATLFAAIFYGANGVLDALHGSHPPGFEVAQRRAG